VPFHTRPLSHHFAHKFTVHIHTVRL
jgi:hypothetical protein